MCTERGEEEEGEKEEEEGLCRVNVVLMFLLPVSDRSRKKLNQKRSDRKKTSRTYRFL